ncbi:HNH endonuclease [Polycladomyces sp. WAk]|uniref:HNH endonuclease n=1 Tax=Polycladomyces zharkentensis TaxID=2807616 RepID=A0ABS2WN36_9BACL|nr:HNH endonuclease [Polycladomyces sp. WAk]
MIKNNLSDSELSELLSGRGSATLIERLNKNPKLKEEFLKVNHEWIREGEDGYVWHHYQEEGFMQLVKSRVHGNVRHTGGRQIWGGGR